jgi:hypothetical protein
MSKTVMCFQGVLFSLQVKFTIERKIAGFAKTAFLGAANSRNIGSKRRHIFESSYPAVRIAGYLNSP